MLTRIRARASVSRTDLAVEGDVSPCRPPSAVDGPSSGFCMSHAPAATGRTPAGPRAASRGVRGRHLSWAESRQRRPNAQRPQPTGKAGLRAATNDGGHFAATTDTVSTSAPATLSYPGFLVPGTLLSSVADFTAVRDEHAKAARAGGTGAGRTDPPTAPSCSGRVGGRGRLESREHAVQASRSRPACRVPARHDLRRRTGRSPPCRRARAPAAKANGLPTDAATTELRSAGKVLATKEGAFTWLTRGDGSNQTIAWSVDPAWRVGDAASGQDRKVGAGQRQLHGEEGRPYCWRAGTPPPRRATTADGRRSSPRSRRRRPSRRARTRAGGPRPPRSTARSPKRRRPGHWQCRRSLPRAGRPTRVDRTGPESTAPTPS